VKTRRQHVLKIRLSDVEWAHLQNVFPKRAVGTSLRARAMDQPVPRRDLTRHLARIGNNLNQVASKGSNRTFALFYACGHGLLHSDGLMRRQIRIECPGVNLQCLQSGRELAQNWIQAKLQQTKGTMINSANVRFDP